MLFRLGMERFVRNSLFVSFHTLWLGFGFRGWKKVSENAPIDNWRSTWMGVPCHLHRSDSPEVHPILFHKKESSKWPVDNVASVGRWQAAARFYWVGWHAFRLVCGEWGWLWTRSLVEDSKRSIRPIAGIVFYYLVYLKAAAYKILFRQFVTVGHYLSCLFLFVYVCGAEGQHKPVKLFQLFMCLFHTGLDIP